MQFDKLLLAIIFLVLLFFITHLLHHAGDAVKEYFQWTTNIASGVVGALIGLITGRGISSRSDAPSPKPEAPAAGGGDPTAPAGPAQP